jgi:hypothetical protein
VFLILAVLEIAQGLWEKRRVWGVNPDGEFSLRLDIGWAIDVGWAIRYVIVDVLLLVKITLIMLIISGVGYLFLMRPQRVDLRQAFFNWPVVAVTAVVILLLFFTDISFLGFL